MQNSLFFGGNVFVFAGDFWQILSVAPADCRAQIVSASLKSSSLYYSCRTLQLTDNTSLQSLFQDHAASEKATQLPDFLLKVGEGYVTGDSSNYIDLPSYIQPVYRYELLCSDVFDKVEENDSNTDRLKSRAVITT